MSKINWTASAVFPPA